MTQRKQLYEVVRTLMPPALAVRRELPKLQEIVGAAQNEPEPDATPEERTQAADGSIDEPTWTAAAAWMRALEVCDRTHLELLKHFVPELTGRAR